MSKEQPSQGYSSIVPLPSVAEAYIVLEHVPVRSGPPVNFATGALLAMVTTDPIPVMVAAAEVWPWVVVPTAPDEPVTAHPRKFGIVTLTREQRLALKDTASTDSVSHRNKLRRGFWY